MSLVVYLLSILDALDRMTFWSGLILLIGAGILWGASTLSLSDDEAKYNREPNQEKYKPWFAEVKSNYDRRKSIAIRMIMAGVTAWALTTLIPTVVELLEACKTADPRSTSTLCALINNAKK